MHPLAVYRARHDLSQAALAALLGMAQSTIANIERGADPSLSLLRRIVELSGGELSADDFLWEYDDGQESPGSAPE